MAWNKILSIAALGILSLSGCGGGGSDDSGDGSSGDTARACSVIGLNSKVINGVSCADVARASVVRIVAVLNVNGTQDILPICSGTLITPDAVLSATHCFLNQSISGFQVLGYGILTGEFGSASFVGGRGLSFAPEYRREEAVRRTFNDAAVLFLSSPVSLPIVPVLLSREVAVNEPGFVYGYGNREVNTEPNSSAGDFSSLEAGAMTVRAVTPDHIFVSFGGDDVNVCNGDSGGPIIVEVGGQPAVAGIVSEGSEPGCASGNVTTFTNLQQSKVLRWLADTAPNALVR